MKHDPRHVNHQQDPCDTQGPCPSKPFEGLEQCLSWHQQVWDYMPRACPCHRRRCVSFQFEEQPHQQVVDGYSILKPPHTTTQVMSRVRDRVQVREEHNSANPDDEQHEPKRWRLTYMRDIAFPTSPSRMMPGVPITRDSGNEYVGRYSQMEVPSTYLASRSLLRRDGQDSEGLAEYGEVPPTAR